MQLPIRADVVQHGGASRVQFRTIHGYRRAFLRAGNGPPLLLIHGIGDHSGTWSPLIPDLARRHTVIAPDLLGHGQSDKPRADYSVAGYANAMRDLLSVLGIDRATVVGHSLGGGVAMQFAYQYPDRCERLVLVGSGGVSREVHSFLRLATAPGLAALLSLTRFSAVRGPGTALLRGLKRLDTDLGQDAEELVRLFDAFPEPTALSAFVRTLRAVVDHRGQVITMLDRCYLTCGMPVLLVWGGRDAIIPVAHAHIVHAAMPGSRLIVFPEAGHFPHRSDAQRFLDVLHHFLDTSTPSTFDVEQWRQVLRRGRVGGAMGSPGDLAEEVLADSVLSGT